MQHDWFQKKDIVWPLTPPPGSRVCLLAKYFYHVAASVVSFNFIWNMTTFRKIYSLTFWPLPLGQGCVCGQNICYHIAASVVSFNLICNMTIFWNKNQFWPRPHHLSPPTDSDQGLQTEIPLYMFHIDCCSVCMQNFSKNINNYLSYFEIKIFDFWPLGEVNLRCQRGWGKTLTLPCLSTGTWQSWSIVRSC